MNSNEPNPEYSSIATLPTGRRCASKTPPETQFTARRGHFRKAAWKPWISHAMLIVLMLLAFLVPHANAATITWYGSGVGGGDGFTWTNSHNWLGNVVPGPSDDVIIGPDAGNPAIEITTAVTIGSINSQHPIAILNGSLTVTSGASSINAATTLTGASLYAQSGAVLSLPQATTYTGSNSRDTTLSANGALSKIDLSHLTSFKGGGIQVNVALYTTHVLATNGGEIDLAGDITTNPSGANRNDITATGLSSVLGVEGITKLTNTNLAASASLTFSVTTTLTNVDATAPAGVILSFPIATTLTGVSLTASGGGQMLFPVCTSYTGSNSGDTTLSAGGALSKIDLSHLTSFKGGGIQVNVALYTTHVLATNGGEIDLAGDITTNPSGANRNDITATGLSSVLGVEGITKLTNTNLAASASLTFSVTTTLTNVDATAPAGAILSFPVATTLTGVSLTASGGGQMFFPVCTSYTGSNGGDTTLSASGALSKIDLSHLTSFKGGGIQVNVALYATHVLATNGGEIDLAGDITTNPSGANFNDIRQENNGGILGVAGVTNMTNTTLAVSGGPVLTFAGLTMLTAVNLTASGGGQMLFPVCTSYTGSNGGDTTLSASGALSKIDLSHLTSFKGGGIQVNVATYTTHVLAANGGEIDLAGAITTNGGNPNNFTVAYARASDQGFAIKGISLANTTINFILNYIPTQGTNLLAVHNTGVEGTFANLGQGQVLNLPYGGKTYSFRSNYLGGTGNDLVLNYLAPFVTTLPASNVTESGATLNGSVNPTGLTTTAHFEYGETTAYGTSTPDQNVGSGNTPVAVQAAISGLLPSKLYYFRLVASNSATPSPVGDAGLTFMTTSGITYTVSPGTVVNGSINPSTPQVINSGDGITFTATPDGGYVVDQWLLNGSLAQTGGGTYTLDNVTANHAVQVTFKPGTVQTYTVLPRPSLSGSITPSTAQVVSSGDSVMFMATPSSGYAVNEWLVDGVSMQSRGTKFTLSDVTTNHTVRATFVAAYTVTPSAGPHGKIALDTPQVINSGGSVTFTGMPDPGYLIDQWLLDGSLAQSGGNPYTLSNITANHTVQVTFKPITYTVTPSPVLHGTINPNTPQVVNSGDSITFTATPDSGYVVNQWLVDSNLVQTGGAVFTLSNIMANHTVEVTFKPETGWFDGFETYVVGTIPATNWVNSGSTAVQVENTVVSTGSKAVSLTGVVGGDLAATIHRLVNLSPSYLVECDVRNGTELVSGAHPWFGGVTLSTGTGATAARRNLVIFDPAGGANNIYAGDPSVGSTPMIGHYVPLQWHHVAVAYETPTLTTVRLSYWVDGTYLGTFLLPRTAYEGNLSYLSLSSNEGTTWFDNVRVSQYSPPKMIVQQPAGITLSNGTSTVDFGPVLAGGTASKTYTIENNGASDLTLGAITIDGVDSPNFTVVSNFPSPPVLQPGANTNFTVTFAPGLVGNRSAVLHIPSSDPAEGLFDINLTGTGSLPSIFFLASSTVVHLGDSMVKVKVKRNFSQAATVDYTTVNDTAVAGIDFTLSQGTLSFPEGDMDIPQEITVQLLYRDSALSPPYFTLVLSNPKFVPNSSPGPSIVNPGVEGIFILNDHPADLSISELDITKQPDAASAATSSISVALFPSQAGGQWRLFGELGWRDGGTTATGLTSGNYEVEFKPVNGYLTPSLQVIPAAAGGLATTSGTYVPSGTTQKGAVRVTFSPANLGLGGWRLQGEQAFRANGETVQNLVTGNYIVEFFAVAGRVTPQSRVAVINAGATTELHAIYLIDPMPGGALPQLVSDSDRTVPPYCFTGQIQTDNGFGSGFVPLNRTVVTAAHVLFDDHTLTFALGVRWFFQRQSNAFEAPPQIPRGAYFLQGYKAQRTADNSPDDSSAASRQLDVAVMYFLEDTARGGQSGYLASDSANNTWLRSPRDKFIVGYPVEGMGNIPGRLYETRPKVQASFAFVAGSLFSTTAIASFPGNSGGPLFVRADNDSFYPAAIYLGGTNETVVRAIDSQVIDLMNRAQQSGSGGADNTGGGVTLTSLGLTGTTAQAFGAIQVNLGPAGIGAHWKFGGETSQRNSGDVRTGLAPGTYTITFDSVSGYTTPGTASVSVTAGYETIVTGTYGSPNSGGPIGPTPRYDSYYYSYAITLYNYYVSIGDYNLAYAYYYLYYAYAEYYRYAAAGNSKHAAASYWWFYAAFAYYYYAQSGDYTSADTAYSQYVAYSYQYLR